MIRPFPASSRQRVQFISRDPVRSDKFHLCMRPSLPCRPTTRGRERRRQNDRTHDVLKGSAHPLLKILEGSQEGKGGRMVPCTSPSNSIIYKSRRAKWFRLGSHGSGKKMKKIFLQKRWFRVGGKVVPPTETSKNDGSV